jgi:outer membrane autotransporter protein
VLNRSLLVGTMVQFDSMRQRSASLATDVSGQGWMAGPYATLRLSEHVFWRIRGAWGQSSNEVSPFLTYTDKFDTERWLASSTLAGRWSYGPWVFKPSASVAYMQDVAQSYTDTYGIVIPDVKSRLGQAKAGPDIGYRYHLNQDVLIEPHAGVQVIWNFANDTTAAGFGQINGDPAGPAGVRGRAEVGLRASTSMGISLDLSGSYDGIGASDYNAFTGRATVRVPLN